MTNKLFNSDCKTDFRSILDELSSFLGLFIFTTLRRDVYKDVVSYNSLLQSVATSDGAMSVEMFIND